MKSGETYLLGRVTWEQNKNYEMGRAIQKEIETL